MGKDFDDIHDLLAMRVLRQHAWRSATPPSASSTACGIRSPTQFDDYIANPKPNGYQSLHTTVMYEGTTPLEIQIRTREMHHVAEYGVAAHWRYKEGEKKDLHFEERIGWLRQLIEWHRELSGAEEFLESVKTDIFIDQVFVYTPKGEIKDLPKGATPLDFAYRVHTDLGHRCVGAKVNGRLVPLSYQLKNGDVVEIMTSKTARGPAATGSTQTWAMSRPLTPGRRSGSGSRSRNGRRTLNAAVSCWKRRCGNSASISVSARIWPGRSSTRASRISRRPSATAASRPTRSPSSWRHRSSSPRSSAR